MISKYFYLFESIKNKYIKIINDVRSNCNVLNLFLPNGPYTSNTDLAEMGLIVEKSERKFMCIWFLRKQITGLHFISRVLAIPRREPLMSREANVHLLPCDVLTPLNRVETWSQLQNTNRRWTLPY